LVNGILRLGLRDNIRCRADGLAARPAGIILPHQ
jgi:hypothetical protein